MTHLVRALFSLMMRSTDAGAPVVFRTSDTEGEVRLEISCDAHLVRPMSLRAFTSSFQTHENQAAGLACASVQRIAEVHGGRVDIQSLDDVFSLRVAFPAA
jgi:nitrogen fixation/metabolism regulation signal transduction histidine kinase